MNFQSISSLKPHHFTPIDCYPSSSFAMLAGGINDGDLDVPLDDDVQNLLPRQ